MSEKPVVRRWHDGADARRFRELGLWGDATVAEIFDRQAESGPDKPAVLDGHRRWTYGELRDYSLRLAAALPDLGVRPGDVVAAQVPSCSLLPVIHLAANRIGSVFLPLSTTWRAAEVGAILKVAQAPLVIVPGDDAAFDFAGMVEGLRAELPALRRVITSGEGGELDELVLRTPLPSRERLEARRPSADDAAHAMTTSGTTGVPKVSLWSSNNLVVLLLQQFAQAIALRRDDVAGALAPANTGSTGYAFAVLAPLLAGASSVMLEHWEPRAALELLSRNRCTYATAIPTQMVQLLTLPIEDYDLSALDRFNNAGAPLAPAVAREIEARIGCRVQTIYGATDGGVPVMTRVDDPDEPRQTSVGRLCIGQELALVDATGAAVPEGEPGEVVWRGANKSYGYLNQPDYDAAAWDKGWFKSGDLGQVDRDGYLHIVGRTKDMILRGGTNIFPAEIEGLLMEHPAVGDIAIVGIPDRVLGERACAFVVPASGGSEPTLPDLCDYLLGRQIAKWKLPERIELVQELPRNAGGKIDKQQLRERAAQLAAQEQTR